MTLKHVSLVTLQVRDFDAMVAWYRDTLGLVIQWFEPAEFCTLQAADGGTALALATDHPDRISDRPGIGWAPTFAVDDLDSTVRTLREAGVTFEGGEEGADEGYRLVRIRDPEGNPVGLTT